jgi:apolipoprotein N-acyltransferase
MPTEAVVKPTPTPVVASPGTRVRHPFALAISSALLLWSTFPPANWSWLGWVALVPLFLLIPSRAKPLWLYLAAWAGGFVFWVIAIHWVRLTDESAWLAWLTMALALSFFWPAFLWLARLAVHALRLPLMIAAPVSWVALEYVRAYAVTGFPWYYLAHSQHAVLPVIQIADFTGSLGVSVLIAIVNAWVVDLLTLPLLRPTPRGPRLAARQRIRLGFVTVLLGGTLIYGAYRLGSAQFRPGLRVALIQSSLIQRYKESTAPEKLLAMYEKLIMRAIGAAPPPDLIVWPETSYPYGFIVIDPALDLPSLEAQLKQITRKVTLTVDTRLTQRDAITRHLHSWTDALTIPMLVGSVKYDHGVSGLSRHNSAILFQPGAPEIQCVDKMHLVPFGEYVPLIETFPWLVALTPYRGSHIPSLIPGRDPVWLSLGSYRIATAICFEDTVPQVVRRFFREVKDGRPPDMILNLSNDGWFHGSSEHDMHLAVSIFRAIEHRVPLARAANTGISAIVDGNGRVVASLGKLEEGVLAGSIPLDDREGAYTTWGDWLGQLCLAVTIGFIPLGYLYPRYARLRPGTA